VFDVVGFATEFARGAGKLRGVVGVFSADGEDEVGGMTEVDEGCLAVFGGVADGVVKDDFDLGSLTADFLDEGADAVDGLGGLITDVIWMNDDAGIWEVTLEASDFNMAFLSDDDGEVATGDEFGEFGMSDFDKGAGGISDAVTGFFPALAVFVSGPVSGDNDVWGGC